ncbi:hypothetical protein Pgy4_42034, partial [Pseudomonas savastanoi pv. glycinea str. race 4]
AVSRFAEGIHVLLLLTPDGVGGGATSFRGYRQP